MRKDANTMLLDKDDDLKVFLFNVGQGDQILLRLPEGGYGIIDSNYDFNNLNQLEPPILSFFKRIEQELIEDLCKKAKKETPDENIAIEAQKQLIQKIPIEFLCISHTDSDHIKGIYTLVDWLFKNKIPIKRFWISGAKDERRYNKMFTSFLKKITQVDRSFKSKAIKKTNIKIGNYKRKISKIFDTLDTWPHNDKKIIKDYLSAFKIVDNNICKNKNLKVRCIGPWDDDLDTFEEISYVNHIKKIFGDIFIPDEESLQRQEEERMNTLPVNERDFWKPIRADKNLMSHLIWITYFDQNLLFTGDTHGNIIERSLDNYLDRIHNEKDPDTFFKNCEFVKAPHHGSKNSSTIRIWSDLKKEQTTNYFGVSAGKNESYLHPNSKFLKDINEANAEAVVLCTNICGGCLNYDLFDQQSGDNQLYERQNWFKEYLAESGQNVGGLEEQLTYEDALEEFSNDEEQFHLLKSLNSPKTQAIPPDKQKVALLAYEFNFSGKAKNVKYHVYDDKNENLCFYDGHDHKLRDDCYPKN